jgi:oligopeptide transport system ATP-binding protein
MALLLDVRDLATRFRTDGATVHAVNGISFTLEEGQSMGIVGESGSGKSVSMMSLMGLIGDPPGRVEGGQALWRGRDLLKMSTAELRQVRGKEIAMVFQDPMTSLNPVLPVGLQMTEMIRRHLKLGPAAARAHAVEMFERVGLPRARERLGDFPFQFSGGQRQRIMIAMALSCSPSLLIADEPTTALDVTIQAQIVDLIQDLRHELRMAVIWISHNLGLVAGVVDKVAVMYGGHIVEQAGVDALFEQPRHPYTRGLLRAMPRLEGRDAGRLVPIDGVPPDLREPPRACSFAPRCAHAIDRCRTELPPLTGRRYDQLARCWRADELAGARSDAQADGLSVPHATELA